MSRGSTVRSDLILVVTAIIWGFAFVAQRMGMEHIGPFLFNGIRFALGALTLVVVQRIRKEWRNGGMGAWRHGGVEAWKQGSEVVDGGEPGTANPEPGTRNPEPGTRNPEPGTRNPELSTVNRQLPAIYGILLGLILFAGASFQQIGLVYTTAGNAGFITDLYVILVPVLGIFSNQKATWNNWAGAVLAVMGLYFLSVAGNFEVNKGDFLVLVSALFWAVHVLYTGWLSPKTSAIRLAIIQFSVCSVLSLFTAFLFEPISFTGIYDAGIPILYGGLLSVGIAYTLQIVAQKKAPPAHAAIIMSLEAVFAVIGGVLILSETMTETKWIGCSLMLLGMVIAQITIGGRQPAIGNESNGTPGTPGTIGTFETNKSEKQ